MNFSSDIRHDSSIIRTPRQPVLRWWWWRRHYRGDMTPWCHGLSRTWRHRCLGDTCFHGNPLPLPSWWCRCTYYTTHDPITAPTLHRYFTPLAKNKSQNATLLQNTSKWRETNAGCACQQLFLKQFLWMDSFLWVILVFFAHYISSVHYM